jgi:hypothetical protein
MSETALPWSITSPNQVRGADGMSTLAPFPYLLKSFGECIDMQSTADRQYAIIYGSPYRGRLFSEGLHASHLTSRSRL